MHIYLKTQENDDSLKYLFNKEKNALSELGTGMEYKPKIMKYTK